MTPTKRLFIPQSKDKEVRLDFGTSTKSIHGVWRKSKKERVDSASTHTKEPGYGWRDLLYKLFLQRFVSLKKLTRSVAFSNFINEDVEEEQEWSRLKCLDRLAQQQSQPVRTKRGITLA